MGGTKYTFSEILVHSPILDVMEIENRKCYIGSNRCSGRVYLEPLLGRHTIQSTNVSFRLRCKGDTKHLRAKGLVLPEENQTKIKKLCLSKITEESCRKVRQMPDFLKKTKDEFLHNKLKEYGQLRQRLRSSMSSSTSSSSNQTIYMHKKHRPDDLRSSAARAGNIIKKQIMAELRRDEIKFSAIDERRRLFIEKCERRLSSFEVSDPSIQNRAILRTLAELEGHIDQKDEKKKSLVRRTISAKQIDVEGEPTYNNRKRVSSGIVLGLPNKRKVSSITVNDTPSSLSLKNTESNN